MGYNTSSSYIIPVLLLVGPAVAAGTMVVGMEGVEVVTAGADAEEVCESYDGLGVGVSDVARREQVISKQYCTPRH